jgi:small subunit ribosomal protein S8
MLTRIRNANQMRNATVSMPTSKVKVEIARILKEEGYIVDYVVDGDVKKTLTLTLKYSGNERVITGLKRISKPGLRVYAEATNLPKVLNGLGIAIISTSKGMTTDKVARKNGVGGEVVAYVW